MVAALRPDLPSSGERRQQLTVMFCDLVGYSARSGRLDPEDLLEIQRAFITACRTCVENYEGHVAQEPGDALVVYFGWPKAHEDDAERCVRAALEIVEAVEQIPSSEPLAAHIGIATGEVAITTLAIGESPNLAARLQSTAKAHEVLIADATRRLVRGAFDLTDLGTQELKDFPSARVWRVEGLRAGAERFHPDGPLSALVGRAEEVALLKRQWQLVRGGSGRAVLIGGEAGIGKSRLAEVLREAIEGEPHTTLRYHCSPFHLNAALHPVIAQIELAAGFAREDAAEQKLEKLDRILAGSTEQRHDAGALLAALLSLPTAPLGLSPQKQKEKTLEALVAQVEAHSRVKPVLMVVEDAHWIDPTSEELLDALVPRLKSLPVMLMVTHRPSYAPRWSALGHVTALSLAGLPNDESAELARNVAKGKALPAEVLDQLVARADGVPLFLEELTKSMLESGLLHEEADRFTQPMPLPALAIPTTLNALLIARLDRREGVRELAQIGACIGRSFSYELLAAVSAKADAELDDDLEQLAATELVFGRGTPPDATYTFKHALVQDAAYGSLLKSRRQQFHARIADVLDSRFPQSVADQPALLARHRTEAGQLLAAIPLWRRAGESAFARVALQEAVAYLEKGLAIVQKLPPSADRDSLELSIREPLHSARLRWRGWAAPQVGVNATAILGLAEKQRRPESLLIGLWGMWINTITQGRVEESLEWARRLMTEGTQTGNIDLEIFGHRALLSSHFYAGELREAVEQRDRILALYDPAHARRWMELTGNDTRTAAGVFGSQSLWMLGFPDRALAVCDQKDADARHLGQPFDVGWALTWGAYVLDYRREPGRLLACADEADRLAREQSIPVLFNVLVPMVRGLALLRKGEFPEAICSLRAGIEGWQSTGGFLNLPYVKCALAEALARRGDLDEGLRVLEDCLEQIDRPRWHERVWLPETLRLKGWVLMRQGKRAEAETQLLASIDWARRQHARSWELRSATTLAELLAASGDRDARDTARELLAPVYDWFANDSKEGLTTHDLKVARSLLDDLRPIPGAPTPPQS